MTPYFLGLGDSQNPQLRTDTAQSTVATHALWQSFLFPTVCTAGGGATARRMATKPLVTPEEIMHGCSGPERPVVDSEGLGHCLHLEPDLVTSLVLSQPPEAHWHTLPVHSL